MKKLRFYTIIKTVLKIQNSIPGYKMNKLV